MRTELKEFLSRRGRECLMNGLGCMIGIEQMAGDRSNTH